jgi:DNA-directed RNA polymerase subunit RPC12/RpoP
MTQPTIEDTQLRCPHCQYNLTALTCTVCPECGKQFYLSATPRPEPIPSSLKFTSRAMTCPACSWPNDRFMPKACVKCGHAFSIWQRIFGVGKFRIG